MNLGLQFGLLSLLAAASCSAGEGPPSAIGDPARGKVIVGRQACGSCHEIPGLLWADGVAGPPLDGLARRAVIAGVLPNTSENLVRWLKSPQSIVPGNAMPDLGLTDRQARDVAAYLLELPA